MKINANDKIIFFTFFNSLNVLKRFNSIFQKAKIYLTVQMFVYFLTQKKRFFDK